MQSIIVDTGPLVALLDRREKRHEWAAEQLRTLPLPWITCEAVLTEAWHLLRRWPDGQDGPLAWVSDGVLQVPFSLAKEIEGLRGLRERFRDMPMSLADACLVRLAEWLPQCTVLTLDSDFHVYRRHPNEPIPVIQPNL
ncbi:MAG TPA: PIN domain-containing protein [Verrucomicrobiales bacterium]|nr:PIN domain-containing protein [Verrucomicrobiales bacterium]